MKLNNKGYMLVEIILASAIAFGVAYFLLELTIKLKNKNDDMFVKTLTSTDQAIITNIIMEDLYSGGANSFNCDNIKINGNAFTYNGKTNVVNEYAKLGNKTCANSSSEISITIPLKVEILDDDFNINIKYKK